MKTLILAAVLSLATTSAFATCKSDTADKKLHGAAATSHMKKCESDAKAKCEAELQGKETRRRRQDEPHEEVRRRLGRHLIRSL